MPTDPKDHNIKPIQAEFTKAIATPRTLRNYSIIIKS